MQTKYNGSIESCYYAAGNRAGVVSDNNPSTASANPANAAAGTVITLTAAPNSGYRFKEWETSPALAIGGDGEFTMPAENVTIKAIFKATGTQVVAPVIIGELLTMLEDGTIAFVEVLQKAHAMFILQLYPAKAGPARVEPFLKERGLIEGDEVQSDDNANDDTRRIWAEEPILQQP